MYIYIYMCIETMNSIIQYSILFSGIKRFKLNLIITMHLKVLILYTYKHTHIYTRACKHAHAYAGTHAHTQIRTHVRTQSRMHSHAYARDARIPAHLHKSIHSRSHTNKHINTYTYTQIKCKHTQIIIITFSDNDHHNPSSVSAISS